MNLNELKMVVAEVIEADKKNDESFLIIADCSTECTAAVGFSIEQFKKDAEFEKITTDKVDQIQVVLNLDEPLESDRVFKGQEASLLFKMIITA